MAKALTPEQAALRAEVEAAVRAELVRLGTRIGFRKARVVKPFRQRGVHLATLYRWIDGVLATEDPELAAADAIAAAAAARVKRQADMERAEEMAAAEVAREVIAKLPTVPAPAALGRVGAAPVLQRLNVCFSVAEELMGHARTPEGKIRNPGLLLSASKHMLKTVETTVRVTDALLRAEKVAQFHQALVDAIAEESPVVAERIMARVERVIAVWLGETENA